MFTQPDQIQFQLPPWLLQLARSYTRSQDLTTRVALVIEASRRNVEMQTGGPFGAGIFDSDSGELIALGANLVTSENMSMLHAEMVTIALAQRKLGNYYLSGYGLPNLELITSTEPCTMCLGGILWSGIRRVIAAAEDGDAREIGFDEGPKPENWVRSLQERGIEVSTGISRQQARAVLQLYDQTQGHIYVGRKVSDER